MPKKSSSDRIKRLIVSKNRLNLEGKRKLLRALKMMKECGGTGNVGGETDIVNADNFVAENEFTSGNTTPERNPIAKMWDTESDFDSYVNQRRGVEWTQKEFGAVEGFKKARPIEPQKFRPNIFYVKYENTDNFGTNSTWVIKKYTEGSQFCWTSYGTYKKAEDTGEKEEPETPEKETPEKTTPEPKSPPLPPLKEAAPAFTPKPKQTPPTQQPKQAQPQQKQQKQPTPQVPATPKKPEPTPEPEPITDPIRVTKSITFSDENEGANLLADFLRYVIKVPSVN